MAKKRKSNKKELTAKQANALSWIISAMITGLFALFVIFFIRSTGKRLFIDLLVAMIPGLISYLALSTAVFRVEKKRLNEELGFCAKQKRRKKNLTSVEARKITKIGGIIFFIFLSIIRLIIKFNGYMVDASWVLVIILSILFTLVLHSFLNVDGKYKKEFKEANLSYDSYKEVVFKDNFEDDEEEESYKIFAKLEDCDEVQIIILEEKGNKTVRTLKLKNIPEFNSNFQVKE